MLSLAAGVRTLFNMRGSRSLAPIVDFRPLHMFSDRATVYSSSLMKPAVRYRLIRAMVAFRKGKCSLSAARSQARGARVS